MAIKKFKKQPGDTLDYDFDFTKWFAGRASNIASHSVPVVDPGITLVTHGRTGKVVKLVLAGGTSGQSYKVTFHITTDDATPLIKEVEALFTVTEL